MKPFNLPLFFTIADAASGILRRCLPLFFASCFYTLSPVHAADPVELGPILADSESDYSVNDGQGYKGWFYLRVDEANGYDPGSLIPLQDRDGAEWWPDSISDSVTFPRITKTDAIPGANRSSAVRRWVSTDEAQAVVVLRMRKINLEGGDGVEVRLYHNGEELFSHRFAPSDGEVVEKILPVELKLNDTLDLVTDAVGGNENDNTQQKMSIHKK